MISFKSLYIAIATAMVIFGNSRVGTAFVIPENARAKGGGNKNRINGLAPPETLSFASMFQKFPVQQSPRMSEASFRLDYIQGIRPSFNSIKAPAINPIEDETHEIEEDFVYGKDSTCYRGLTKPSKAGMVVALVLASSMAIASPEIHLSMPSQLSLLEGTRHLFGEHAGSATSAFVEEMSFRLDMMSLPDSFQQVSNQATTSFQSNVVPFVTQQTGRWQEVLVGLPSGLGDLSAQISSQTDTVKEEVIGRMTSAGITLDHVLASVEASIAQHTNGWQHASHAQIEQWQHDLQLVSDHISVGTIQAWNQARDSLFEMSSHLHDAGQAKSDQIQHMLTEDGNRFQMQVAQGEDSLEMNLSKVRDLIQVNMNQIKSDTLDMTKQVQVSANQFSSEAKDIYQNEFAILKEGAVMRIANLQREIMSEISEVQQKMDVIIPEKFSEIQKLSHSSMNDVEKSASGLKDNVRTMFANAGADFHMKRKEIVSGTMPIIQEWGQLLRNKMMAFQDSSSANFGKMQEQVAFQSDASMDSIGENLQKLREGAAVQFSRFEESSKIPVGSIGHLDDSMKTESVFLKSILNEMIN